jgi:hypothetical protein
MTSANKFLGRTSHEKCTGWLAAWRAEQKNLGKISRINENKGGREERAGKKREEKEIMRR